MPANPRSRPTRVIPLRELQHRRVPSMDIHRVVAWPVIRSSSFLPACGPSASPSFRSTAARKSSRVRSILPIDALPAVAAAPCSPPSTCSTPPVDDRPTGSFPPHVFRRVGQRASRRLPLPHSRSGPIPPTLRRGAPRRLLHRGQLSLLGPARGRSPRLGRSRPRSASRRRAGRKRAGSAIASISTGT